MPDNTDPELSIVLEPNGSMQVVGAAQSVQAMFNLLDGQALNMGLPQTLMSPTFVGGLDDYVEYIAVGFGFSENGMTTIYYVANFHTVPVWGQFCIPCAIAQALGLVTASIR